MSLNSISGLKYIDLFSGIGGFHFALNEVSQEAIFDLKCVMSAEIDKRARECYQRNFYDKDPDFFDSGMFKEDITKVPVDEIPDFDLMCAGFPCQPFSQAGRQQGFNDENRGNLFFTLEKILRSKRPLVFFLENVRNLVSHDDGNTFLEIQTRLLKLGYTFAHAVLKASDYEIPQHRPRTYMVGFDRTRLKTEAPEFVFSQGPGATKTLEDLFGVYWCERDVAYTLRCGGRGSPYGDRHNWDAYKVRRTEDSEEEILRIGPREGKALMGFPSDWFVGPAEGPAMKQLGNSVSIPVIKSIANDIVNYVQEWTLAEAHCDFEDLKIQLPNRVPDSFDFMSQPEILNLRSALPPLQLTFNWSQI